MSETKHTPELLIRFVKARHTPEPWVFCYGSIYQGNNPDTVEENTGRLALADRDNPHTQPTERDANCARIVACVNACAGMEDPAVELAELRADLTAAEEQVRFAKEIIAETRVQRDALRAERDELRAALSVLFEFCEQDCRGFADFFTCGRAAHQMAQARAALARCEKGER